MTSGLIFDFELMHVAKSGSSVAMERDGLRQILLRLQEAPFVVGQLATDRNSTIKAMMQHDFDWIVHQFDIWHFVKSIVEKLTKATTKRRRKVSGNGSRPLPITFGV